MGGTIFGRRLKEEPISFFVGNPLKQPLLVPLDGSTRGDAQPFRYFILG